MNTYRIKVEVVCEIDAYSDSDAREVVLDTVYELSGLGVTVTEVTVQESTEDGRL